MRSTTWKTLIPIFADVVISPWNLLVGGFLVAHLRFFDALLAITIGYGILAVVFIIYGGLGTRYQKRTAQLLSYVFGKNGTRLIIPLLLAVGQIGWYAINTELGGNSLAFLMHVPPFLGIVLYSAILILMALLRLHHLSFIKLLITISSLALLVFLFIGKLIQGALITSIPYTLYSLGWGISVVVASLSSFASVTPDFFAELKTRNDVIKSTLVGMVLPGIATASLGAFLFTGTHITNLSFLITSLSFSAFTHFFNVLTNTDGAIAIYTPGFQLQHILGISRKRGTTIAGTIGLIGALIGITSQFEMWLTILGIIYPSLIGVALARYYLFLFRKKRLKVAALNARAVIATFLPILGLPFGNITILTALSPILSFTTYTLLSGIEIRIGTEE